MRLTDSRIDIHKSIAFAGIGIRDLLDEAGGFGREHISFITEAFVGT
jgi:hypothetical protein